MSCHDAMAQRGAKDITDMKTVTSKTIAEVLSSASLSPRKRMNLNLHEQLIDPINRLINAGHAGTYVRPHRHQADRWELLTALRGRFDVLTFTHDGEVTARFSVDPEAAPVIEISGGSWHTVVFHAPGAVMLEVKPGPYDSRTDKEFARWAPEEGTPAAAPFTTWLEKVAVGEKWRK
jgi:cupin fold WbuC family metalloprotein